MKKFFECYKKIQRFIKEFSVESLIEGIRNAFGNEQNPLTRLLTEYPQYSDFDYSLVPNKSDDANNIIAQLDNALATTEAETPPPRNGFALFRIKTVIACQFDPEINVGSKKDCKSLLTYLEKNVEFKNRWKDWEPSDWDEVATELSAAGAHGEDAESLQAALGEGKNTQAYNILKEIYLRLYAQGIQQADTQISLADFAPEIVVPELDAASAGAPDAEAKCRKFIKFLLYTKIGIKAATNLNINTIIALFKEKLRARCGVSSAASKALVEAHKMDLIATKYEEKALKLGESPEAMDVVEEDPWDEAEAMDEVRKDPWDEAEALSSPEEIAYSAKQMSSKLVQCNEILEDLEAIITYISASTNYLNAVIKKDEQEPAKKKTSVPKRITEALAQTAKKAAAALGVATRKAAEEEATKKAAAAATRKAAAAAAAATRKAVAEEDEKRRRLLADAQAAASRAEAASARAADEEGASIAVWSKGLRLRARDARRWWSHN